MRRSLCREALTSKTLMAQNTVLKSWFGDEMEIDAEGEQDSESPMEDVPQEYDPTQPAIWAPSEVEKHGCTASSFTKRKLKECGMDIGVYYRQREKIENLNNPESPDKTRRRRDKSSKDSGIAGRHGSEYRSGSHSFRRESYPPRNGRDSSRRQRTSGRRSPPTTQDQTATLQSTLKDIRQFFIAALHDSESLRRPPIILDIDCTSDNIHCWKKIRINHYVGTVRLDDIRDECQRQKQRVAAAGKCLNAAYYDRDVSDTLQWFGSDHFDIVTALSGSLSEYFDSKERAVAFFGEVARLLKPNHCMHAIMLDGGRILRALHGARGCVHRSGLLTIHGSLRWKRVGRADDFPAFGMQYFFKWGCYSPALCSYLVVDPVLRAVVQAAGLEIIENINLLAWCKKECPRMCKRDELEWFRAVVIRKCP